MENASTLAGGPAPLYTLVMTTVLQNEASFLPEWLEYHMLRSIGFEHFYLYDDGSTDALAPTVAPYVAEGLVTLTPVTSLGRLPDTVQIPSSECEENRQIKDDEMPRWWHEGRCVKRLPFPQQVAVVYHAVRTYGNLTRWMAFFDVDEFVRLAPQYPSMPAVLSRLQSMPLKPQRDGSALRVVGMMVDQSIMLPRRANDTRPPPPGALLMSHFVRQLVPSMLPMAKTRFKCVLQPGWLHPQRYGTIHRLGLRQGGAYALPDPSDVTLLHFRYRWMHTFENRLRRKYMTNSSGAARTPLLPTLRPNASSRRSSDSLLNPQRSALVAPPLLSRLTCDSRVRARTPARSLAATTAVLQSSACS